jgi:hypothetical protein
MRTSRRSDASSRCARPAPARAQRPAPCAKPTARRRQARKLLLLDPISHTSRFRVGGVRWRLRPGRVRDALGAQALWDGFVGLLMLYTVVEVPLQMVRALMPDDCIALRCTGPWPVTERPPERSAAPAGILAAERRGARVDRDADQRVLPTERAV